MIFRRFISITFLSLAFFTVSPAQISPMDTDSKKEKAALELEKTALEMLEQTVGEAATLKLAENRALVYAMAGDAFWSKNEKRARQLFRNAANEIVQGNNTASEKSASAVSNEATLDGMEIYNLRRLVLLALAAHDAKMALELLQTTRPAEVGAAMLNYLSPAAESVANGLVEKRQRNYRIEQEIQLEQSIAARAAEQDPQRAAKLIRESLAKGMSFEMMNLIGKVAEKDIELANKLLGETIEKLLEIDLSARQDDMFFAINTLRKFAAPKRANPDSKGASQLKPDDKLLKDLANKVADSLLKATSSIDNSMTLNWAMPILEKLTPEKIARLRQKQAETNKLMWGTSGTSEPPRSLNDPNATPETLLADAAKADSQMRPAFYYQAAERAIANGEEEKLRPLLQKLPEGKERDDVLNRLDTTLAAKHLQAGRLEEARKIVDRMSLGNSKVEQIVGLAVASHRLNTKESKEAALKLMDEARQMVNDFPEDRDETEGLLKIVAGYATIEPPRAFALLAPVVEQANDLINAGAILAKFNKQNQIFRNGEIVMANGFGGASANFFRYAKELKMLAQADLGRTRALVDHFRRQDVRVFLNMFVAQAVLKEKIGLEGATFNSF